MIYLDTHVLVWLYNGLIEKISLKGQSLIEKHTLLMSPMSILELQYLYDIKKITVPAQKIRDDLIARLGLGVDSNSFDNVVKHSLGLSWTRDPFDRLIVAGAQLQGISLLTKDEIILTQCSIAVWD